MHWLLLFMDIQFFNISLTSIGLWVVEKLLSCPQSSEIVDFAPYLDIFLRLSLQNFHVNIRKRKFENEKQRSELVQLIG